MMDLASLVIDEDDFEQSFTQTKNEAQAPKPRGRERLAQKQKATGDQNVD